MNPETGTTVTVTVYHNIADDLAGDPSTAHIAAGHIAVLDGYRPGDPMVRVFAYEADPAPGPGAIADQTLITLAGNPDARTAGLFRRYCERNLRYMTIGDAVVIGETALAATPAGWQPVTEPFTESVTGLPRSRPLPDSGPRSGTAGDPAAPARPAAEGDPRR